MIFTLAKLTGLSPLLVKAGLAVALMAALAAGIAFYNDALRDEGKAEIKAANERATTQQLEERNRINDEIDQLDAVALCRELGGLQCDGAP